MKYLILLSFFVYFLILLSQKLNIPPFFNINVFFMFYFILFLLYFFKIKKIHTLKPKKAFLFLKTTPKKVIILNLPLTPIERIRLIWLKFKRKIKRSYGRFKTIVIQFYNWILLKFNIINSKIENLKILIYMRYLFIGDQVTRIYLKIQKSIKIIYKNIKNLISYSVLYIKKKLFILYIHLNKTIINILSDIFPNIRKKKKITKLKFIKKNKYYTLFISHIKK